MNTHPISARIRAPLLAAAALALASQGPMIAAFAGRAAPQRQPQRSGVTGPADVTASPPTTGDGRASTAAAVPEPSSSILTVIGAGLGIGLFFRRRLNHGRV